MSDTDHTTVDQDPLEKRSLLAAIKSLHVNRWILFLTLASTIVAIVGFAVSCQPKAGETGQTVMVTGSGNSVNQNSGSCGQVSNNSTCIVQLQESVDEANKLDTDAEFKKALATEATEATATLSGAGPWPFVVIDTVIDGKNYGLYARTTNQVEAERLGTAANRSIIWADCVARSDYTPTDVTGENNVGPQWLQVRWSPVAPTQRSVSEPTGRQRAWMYLRFTPNGGQGPKKFRQLLGVTSHSRWD